LTQVSIEAGGLQKLTGECQNISGKSKRLLASGVSGISPLHPGILKSDDHRLGGHRLIQSFSGF
jgi:hypothetical protein